MGSFKFQHRVFLLLLSVCAILIVSFLCFQYNRERNFKARQLDEQLQFYNITLLDAIEDGDDIREFIATHTAPFEVTRISVIDSLGKVVYDNTLDRLPSTNHLDRPEIQQALANGTGFTTRRHSKTTDDTYFYSAMSHNGMIVRTAVPYSSMSVEDLLKADQGFLWFLLFLTIGICILGYFASRTMSQTVQRLNAFAARAQRGERIYDDSPFPNDDLGEISHHIVSLYAKLQAAKAESDRRHAEALHQQNEKIRIKKQLTNNINHELKTPLAGIQVCLETVLDHPDLEESKRIEFLKRCQNNADRLNSMLEDVATLMRLDDGAPIISKEPISLNNVLAELQRDFPTPKYLPIDIDIPENVRIHANESLIYSAFRNLIVNANAYAQASKITIKCLSLTSDRIVLEVADDGVGIDPIHHSKIFERFYRIDKGRSRDKGGTGLGLAIAKNAILFHGGNIKVGNRNGASQPYGGLVFIISLPLG